MRERLKDFAEAGIIEAADDFDVGCLATSNRRSQNEPNHKLNETGLMWAAQIKKLKVVRKGGKTLLERQGQYIKRKDSIGAAFEEESLKFMVERAAGFSR